jgi:hypothetical protein
VPTWPATGRAPPESRQPINVSSECLSRALQEAAAAYKSLHIKALGAGLKMPRSATIESDKTGVWSKDDLIGAQDWMAFDNKGWALVDDLPDLPEGFERTFYLAQELGDPPAEIVPVSARLPALCALCCVFSAMARLCNILPVGCLQPALCQLVVGLGARYSSWWALAQGTPAGAH